MYDVFKKNYVDKIDNIKIYYDSLYMNYRLYKDIIYCLDKNLGKVVSMNLKGEYLLFPYDIYCYEFHIYGDYLFYADEEADLRKVNLITGEKTTVLSNCFEIIEVTEKLVFYFDDENYLVQYKIS